jgi:hypothetical protein
MAAVSAPVREFLTWVARCPRTYDDAMEAWRSSCPRYTVWEDALAAELIHVAPASVSLTPRGQAALAAGPATIGAVADAPRDGAERRGRIREKTLVTVADRPD